MPDKAHKRHMKFKDGGVLDLAPLPFENVFNKNRKKYS